MLVCRRRGTRSGLGPPAAAPRFRGSAASSPAPHRRGELRDQISRASASLVFVRTQSSKTALALSIRSVRRRARGSPGKLPPTFGKSGEVSYRRSSAGQQHILAAHLSPHMPVAIMIWHSHHVCRLVISSVIGISLNSGPEETGHHDHILSTYIDSRCRVTDDPRIRRRQGRRR